MANDYSSIVPLNDTARKEAWPLIGLFLLDMLVTVVVVYIVGAIANAF
jgi:hypothetical protein